MRRLTWCVVGGVCLWAGSAQAEHWRPLGDDWGRWDPGRWNSGYAARRGDFVLARHRGFGHSSGLSWGYSYGPSVYGYGYGPGVFDYYGPYPYYSWPSYSFYYYGRPPIYSANEIFGPNLQGLWNPLGLGGRPVPQVNIITVPGDRDDVVDDAPPPRRRPRRANAASLARAWRFIELGDKDFAQQRYREACQHYRDAARSAPNLVQAYLRQGQARVATGQYDLAAQAFRRALLLGEEIEPGALDLAELYARQPIAQAAHLEALAAAAEEAGADPDLLLLVGLELHFSDQADRARPFLDQAAEACAAHDPELAEAVTQLADAAPARDEADAPADDADVVRF